MVTGGARKKVKFVFIAQNPITTERHVGGGIMLWGLVIVILAGSWLELDGKVEDAKYCAVTEENLL